MVNNITRRNFGKEEKNLPELDLSHVQKESWEKFLAGGIETEISEISPIDDFTGKKMMVIFIDKYGNELKAVKTKKDFK